MPAGDRTELLARAKELRTAERSDFVRMPYPAHADPETLKVITDLDFRRKLIDAGIATMVQSPKGPLQRPYIIQIYPNFDAPRAAARSGPKASPAPLTRSAPARPTVEELAELVERIRVVEDEIAERRGREDAEAIETLQRRIPELRGEALRDAIRRLGALLDSSEAAGNQIREEAFRVIESETAFAPRRFLSLLSRSRS